MALLLALVLPLMQILQPAAAMAADLYFCDADPLSAEVFNGAVDAIGIPNSNGDTVPGAVIVLKWRGISLQLPRTGNAGAPSCGGWGAASSIRAASSRDDSSRADSSHSALQLISQLGQSATIHSQVRIP
jgi:hypothetical protein